MLRNLERKIKVVVYLGEKIDRNATYMVRYHCLNCKNVSICKNPSECDFVRYVRERLPQTQHNYSIDMPQLHIVVANDTEKQRAVRVLNRAQRLRTNRALIERQK